MHPDDVKVGATVRLLRPIARLDGGRFEPHTFELKMMEGTIGKITEINQRFVHVEFNGLPVLVPHRIFATRIEVVCRWCYEPLEAEMDVCPSCKLSQEDQP